MTENAKTILIGRAVSVLYPDIVDQILPKITPLSDDLLLMPKILEAIDLKNPEFIIVDKIILFIAVAHKIYHPACLFNQRISKLRVGLRDAMADCLGFVNSEMINHHLTVVYPSLKNPRFQAKMQAIINHVLPDHQNN